MKIFTNLPGNLRALFGFLRFLTIMLAIFWLLTLTFNTWIQEKFVDEPKLMVAGGLVTLQPVPKEIGLRSDSANPGSLQLTALQGELQMNFCSKDAALVSTLRWTMIPTMVLGIAFAWVLFGSLRSLCANIERGEVFSERNLRVVRSMGVFLIAWSLIGAALDIWTRVLMDNYLSQHVVLTGLTGKLHFQMAPGFISLPAGLVTGLLVLVISEAFRQGLNLKTENDLTV